MAYALIAHTAQAAPAGGGTLTTSAIDTTGASLLVVVVSAYKGGASPTSLSDSKSNTWTALTAQIGSTNTRSQIFYVATSTVGTSHTFKLTGANFGWIEAMAFSGSLASTPFDQQNGGTGTSTNTSTFNAVTPGQSNELIISGLSCTSTTGTFSVDSGLTILDQVNNSAGNNLGGAAAYVIQGAAAAITPKWSWSATNEFATTVATFEASATVEVSLVDAGSYLGAVFIG